MQLPPSESLKNWKSSKEEKKCLGKERSPTPKDTQLASQHPH